MTTPSQPEGVPLGVWLSDGRKVTLREVRPEDGDALQEALRQMSAQARYSRFMSAVRELPASMLERATHPAAGELQLVAVAKDSGREKIVAGARYAAAEGDKNCEFAVAVVDEWQGCGLARQLLELLISMARARGFERMHGYILASNAAMLKLAKGMGFAQIACPEGPAVRLVVRNLVD